MRDKMAISAYILKIVEKDPFLKLKMRAKEDFNRNQFFFHKFFRGSQKPCPGAKIFCKSTAPGTK